MRELVSMFLLAMVLTPTSVAAQEVPDFNRDIRPVFAAKCFACHGPDEAHREAGLRLDQRESAVDLGAIVPGDADQSTLIERITSDDPNMQMPPPQANDTLTDEEKELFRRWIDGGAKYAKHWAFVPPQKSPLPDVGQTDWPRNEIDYFVLARLQQEELSPSPEADRYALVRRVYLDLIGIGPTPQEADAFVQSEEPQAYEKLVDRLLASPHYGQRWARQWLDLARYSDTNGYEKDRPRSIWPYRDWVIRALNDDMPFDQFTIWQLAGDMLPEATESQRVATGFHRNTMLNEEGGIDPLEYRYYAMVDRVATTGTVWLGLTTGCAQCHTHKYDPITHTDYFSLMALLNNADEVDHIVKTPEVRQQRKAILAEIRQAEAALADQFPPAAGDGPEDQRRKQHLETALAQWLSEAEADAQPWQTLVPTEATSNLPRLEVQNDGSVFSTGDITKRDTYRLTLTVSAEVLPLTAIRLEVLPDERLPAGGPGRAYYEGRQGDFFLSELTATFDGDAVTFVTPSHSFGQIAVGSGTADAANVLDGDGSTGWSTATREGEPHQLVLNLQEPITEAGSLEVEMLFERHFAASLGKFRLSGTSAQGTVAAKEMPLEIEAILARPRDQRSETQQAQLRSYFLQTTPLLAEAREPIDKLRGTLPAFPTTLVMQERPADHPRPTHLHHRGEYLSPKQEVSPAIPAFLAAQSSTLPSDRLELARWLVSDDNPLVARVTVNRAWQALFGRGLVETSADFGTQSAPPSHPELLDYLAVQFVEDGWSLKALHRRIVTSATYRQDASRSPELQARDPDNRLLARGPRGRLEAEMIRDAILAGSGLLSEKMYGPGVYPPQPESVTALAYGNTSWKVSQGEDRYRRSLYTFSKRTAPFAAFTVFDAPSGEVCAAQRDRSNTPLQALTLLNDAMFLEMSQALAQQVCQKEASAEEIATEIFRRLLVRPPKPAELEAIVTFYQEQLGRLTAGQLDPATIAGNDAATPSQAAWAMVARAVMNLDEQVMKP